MTISVTEYFQTRKDDRKKETRYLNVINKDSCTSCQSCATVCPVDCIYEVPSPIPGQSYHQIDTSRCIGCQMCYRSPNDSSERYTLTICPWNAIEMVPTELAAQVTAQIGGPPEYIVANWDRLVGTAQHLAELKAAG